MTEVVHHHNADRLLDWLPRLHAYIARVRRLPFEPGAHDDALFAAGAVEAMTGVDHAADLRGTYTTCKGGIKRLQREGYIDHIDLAASLFDEIPNKAMAGVGDLAVVDTGDGDLALGVVGGAQVYVVRQGGLGLVDLTAAKRAFRVA